MSALKKMSSVLPFKLTKKINKTGEGRSGDEIYKRRNRRSYRGLMQYSTWDKIINDPENANFLTNYQEGIVVWISPAEYFGFSYPSKSPSVNKNFKLGKTGFVYYKNPKEIVDYPPLDNWHEVYELKTNTDAELPTWCGEVCFNIKNTQPQKISDICAPNGSKRSKNEILELLKEAGVDLEKYGNDIPEQSGLGNYDYDYANTIMIENVKLQMLYLMLTCEDPKGQNFALYLKNNYSSYAHKDDSNTFKKNINRDDYFEIFDIFFSELEEECKQKGLLDTDKLMKINAWNPIIKRPICPLCSQPLSCSSFFEEVKQQEGRQVADNTQREIVLMHVNALRPGLLNHRVYNLSWGHTFCNTIQGDKDIEETIEELRMIIDSYLKNTRNG